MSDTRPTSLDYALKQVKSTADGYYHQMIMDALPYLPFAPEHSELIGMHARGNANDIDLMRNLDFARVETHTRLLVEFNDKLHDIVSMSPKAYKAAAEFLAISRRLELKSGAMTEAKIRVKNAGDEWRLDAAPAGARQAVMTPFFEEVEKRCEAKMRNEPSFYSNLANNPSFKGTQR